MQDGFTQVPNEVLSDKTLSAQAKLLYSLLLSHAWEENKVFPGQKSLGDRMGCSTKTVRKYIKELENAGYLKKKRRGLNNTYLYTLNKWISSDYERKKLPVKKQKINPIKKGSQLPSKNTQNNHTQFNQTKSEGVNTTPPKFQKGKASYQEIFDECENNLEQVSHITLVDQDDIRTVLKKMASYYAAKGINVENWTDMLTHWVMKDREAGKVPLSELVKQEVREKLLKDRIWNTVDLVLGENWRMKKEGVEEEILTFIKIHGGLYIEMDVLKDYLQFLKEGISPAQ
jgi:DNA-binding Lrp family transcriptional regulator